MTNYRLILMTPAILMVRNVFITSLFVLLRNIPQLALMLAFAIQGLLVFLIMFIKPFHFTWFNYF